MNDNQHCAQSFCHVNVAFIHQLSPVSQSQHSWESFPSVCFLAIAFNLKTGQRRVRSNWDIPLVDTLCCDFKTNTSTINQNKIPFREWDGSDNAFPVLQDTQGQQVPLTRQSPYRATSKEWRPLCQVPVLTSKALKLCRRGT